MEKRSHEVGMDFEYQNSEARVPQDSPFLRGTPRLGTSFQSFSSTRPPPPMFPRDQYRSNLPQTPIKSHVASFRENPALDFSSGPENASSPENNADNEDTPDQSSLRVRGTEGIHQNVTVFRANHSSPSKSKPVAATAAASSSSAKPRRSIGDYFFLPARFSPSHKQLIRRRNSKTDKRPHKRKRRDVDAEDRQLALRRNNGSSQDSEDYDNDDDDGEDHHGDGSRRRPASRGNKSQFPSVHEVGTIPSVLTFIHAHPNLPHILSYYGQLLLGWFFIALIMYGVYCGWTVIRQDVDAEADRAAAGVAAEMAGCAERFVVNGCEGRERFSPEVRRLCDQWEACMHQDAKAVGRAKISAHTFAQILNSFVDPLSYKLMFFSLALIGVFAIVPQALFGSIRRKEAEQFSRHQQQQQQQQQQQYPAQQMQATAMATPRQQPSSSFHHHHQQQDFGGQYQYFTPRDNRAYDAFDPPPHSESRGRSIPGRDDEAMTSPTKRLGYY